METNNGKQTYYADAIGRPLSKPNIASQVASPINLLTPDRYEFYTFNDNGELVKRLMTLKEIQGIIAGGDSDNAGYHYDYNSQVVNPANDVNNIVENVQNVLKEQIEAAHKKPMDDSSKPLLDTPDVSANWNMILPAIFGDTMLNDAVILAGNEQINDGNQSTKNKYDSSTEYIKISSRHPDVDEVNNLNVNVLSQNHTQMDFTTDNSLNENTLLVSNETKNDIMLSSSTSVFSTWLTTIRPISIEHVRPTFTSTENVIKTVADEVTSYTTIQNIDTTIEPVIQSLLGMNANNSENLPNSNKDIVKVNEINPDNIQSIIENKITSTLEKSTESATSNSITSTSRTEASDVITTSITENNYLQDLVKEISTNKSPTTSAKLTSHTVELPKITQLVSLITRPTTKEAEKMTTMRTSTTFPHSSQFVHYTELSQSTTMKTLTYNEEKTAMQRLTTSAPMLDESYHNNNKLNTLTLNANMDTSTVTEAVASYHYQPTESNTNETPVLLTEHSIVADIDQLIANISEDLITNNIKIIPAENYNASNLIQQILNYPTNASDVLNQTVTIASVLIDSNMEEQTTESILNENTDSLMKPTIFSSSVTSITIDKATTPEQKHSIVHISTHNSDTSTSATEKIATTDHLKVILENVTSAELLTSLEILTTSLGTSTELPTVTAPKLTTQNIPKTSTQITENVTSVQPTTVGIAAEILTTLPSANIQMTELPSTPKFDLSDEKITLNTISIEPITTAVYIDKHTVNTSPVPTTLTTQPIKMSEMKFNSTIESSTTVKITTSTVSNSEVVKIDIEREKDTNQVTANNKITETFKTTPILVPTPNTVTQKLMQTVTIQPIIGKTPTTKSPNQTLSVLSTNIPTTIKPTTNISRVQPTIVSTTTTMPPVQRRTTAAPNTIMSTSTSTTRRKINQPSTTTVKSMTYTNLPNKTQTNGILNISEPYRRTEDYHPGKDPSDTWKLVQTVVPPQISSNKKPTTLSNRYSANTPLAIPHHQPTIQIDMSGTTSTSTTTTHEGTFEVPVLSDDMFMFSKTYNELALKFWNALSMNDISADRSATVSPFGVISMLGMIFLGARGGTSNEMNDILKLDDVITFNPHLVFKEVTDSLIARKSLSAVVRELYTDSNKGKVLDFYKERVRQFYDGYVEEVDFKRISNVIRRRTNALINKQTRGKLPQFLEETTLTLKAPLSALSTNIFQADCSKASMSGRDGELYFIVLPTMRQRRLVPIPAAIWRSGFIAGYDPELDATAVSLGSTNQDISTVFVIPGQQGHSAPGDVLLRLEARLLNTTYTPKTWTQLLKSMMPRPGLELQIPRFQHKSVVNTNDALKRMGLTDMFDSVKANLQGLNGIAHDLYFSDMVHINEFSICGGFEQVHTETYPSTNEHLQNHNEQMRNFKYTDHSEDDAAAVEYDQYTSIPLPLRPRQARLPDVPRLRFDRPFLYFVRHNPTGLILHMGRFNPKLIT